MYLARLLQINYARAISQPELSWSSKLQKSFLLWEYLLVPAHGAGSPEAALGRREWAAITPQQKQFPWSAATDQRHSSQREGQLSKVLRAPARACQNIPSFAGISEGVISLCVSSNPSSLSVHLLGSQEQIAEISTGRKGLVSPFLGGCPSGTAYRIWASWGYSDIKITIWSQTWVCVLQCPAYLARSDAYQKTQHYGNYSPVISQYTPWASSKKGKETLLLALRRCSCGQQNA